MPRWLICHADSVVEGVDRKAYRPAGPLATPPVTDALCSMAGWLVSESCKVRSPAWFS